MEPVSPKCQTLSGVHGITTQDTAPHTVAAVRALFTTNASELSVVSKQDVSFVASKRPNKNLHYVIVLLCNSHIVLNKEDHTQFL
jgi:hypothetical protein